MIFNLKKLPQPSRRHFFFRRLRLFTIQVALGAFTEAEIWQVCLCMSIFESQKYIAIKIPPKSNHKVAVAEHPKIIK